MSSKTDQGSRLLIDESPLQVLPTLACLLGLQRALLLQQLHYLLKQPKSGRIIDGEKWIFNSYQEWTEYFPFWHWTTIRMHCQWLEQKGFLHSHQFDKVAGDSRKYYRIDYNLLNQSLREYLTRGTVDYSTPGTVDCSTPGIENCSTHEQSTIPPLEQFTVHPYKEHETSLHETSTKTSLRARESAQLIELPPAPTSPIHEQLENAIQSGCGLQIVAPSSWEERTITQAATSLRALNPPVTVAELGLFFDAQDKVPGLGWVASMFQQWRAQTKKQQQPVKPRLSAIDRWRAQRDAKQS